MDRVRIGIIGAGNIATLNVPGYLEHEHPPLRKARDLIRSGVIGTPTVIRIKTVVGRTEFEFQASLDPAGYTWRFNAESPGGHLFDDVMHKYAMALWLVDDHVRSVQAVGRQGPLFFEAPAVALFEYGRDDLLGMMEVSYAPDMFIRSDFYGADEFFEIQGTRGFIWVTRLCGNLHTGLAPLVLYEEDGRETTFAELDASYDRSFQGAAAAFVDGLLMGTVPDLDPRTAVEALQLCFAVYQASNEQRRIDPAAIDDMIRPNGWPPTEAKLRDDVEAMFRREAARAERQETR